MFGLANGDLAGPVLDCCAGASGFVAGMAARGGTAVAVDPVYGLPRAELARVVRESTTGGTAIVEAHRDLFVWDWYGSARRRESLRAAAAHAFLADLGRRPRAYVAARLPRLPFRDAAVDLALCSHLLFTWADQLDAAWHRAALRELVRVARSIRGRPRRAAGIRARGRVAEGRRRGGHAVGGHARFRLPARRGRSVVVPAPRLAAPPRDRGGGQGGGRAPRATAARRGDR